MKKDNLRSSEDFSWDERAHKAIQEGLLNDEENKEWLDLVHLAMESDVTKEQFRAFLEAEARKRRLGKP